MSKKDDLAYRGDLKPEQIVHNQQDRCCAAQTSGNEEIFDGAVLALLGVVPPEVRYAVEDAQEEAVEKISKIVDELRKTVTVKTPPTNEALIRIIKIIMDVKSSTYTDEVEEWKYESVNGIRLGTIEQPYYRNNPIDLNYDPTLNGGEPILVSPILKIVPRVDYYRLFTRINEELDNFGLGWDKNSNKERDNI